MSIDHSMSSDSDLGRASERDAVPDLPHLSESGYESSEPPRAHNRTTSPSTQPRGVHGGGHARAVSVTPVPVERQTTLVLQGYFMADTDSSDVPSDVHDFFGNLEGTGQRSNPEESFFELGLEINRASMRLRTHYHDDFQTMLNDLGDTIPQIVEGLGLVALKMFSDPNRISWANIVTYISFAGYVIIKKGWSYLRDVWDALISKLKEFNIFKWISGKGGWDVNENEIKNELNSADEDPAIQHNIESAEYDLRSRGTGEHDPGDAPSSWSPLVWYGSGVGVGVAVIGLACLALYISRRR